MGTESDTVLLRITLPRSVYEELHKDAKQSHMTPEREVERHIKGFYGYEEGEADGN